MYAQSTTIRVPLGHMNRMRELIKSDYLPKIRVRPGFVSAIFMEQLDDPDRAELVILWENQAAVEKFNNSGLLEATITGLVAYQPGVQVQRQGYTLTVTMSAEHLEDTRSYAVQQS